jgi:hypothetical protein
MINIPLVTIFIKGQRIQWLGHIMRRGESYTTKLALEWKLCGKRPRGNPRKRWIDVFEEDLRNMGIDAWREMVFDRDR